MELFIATLEAVMSIIGIGVIGFFIISRRILPRDVLSVITPLVIDIALPCMVFANIVTRFEPSKAQGWYTMPLWWVLFTAVTFFLTIMFSYIAKKDTRSEFRVTLFYQNTLFIPIALISGVYGENSHYLVDLFLFSLFFSSFFFNTYYFFFMKRGQASRRTINWKMILNPVLVATLLAVFIKMAGLYLYLPGLILDITTTIGRITVPLIMIIIGGNIYVDLKSTGTIYTGEVLKFIAVKNILFPLIFIGLVMLIRPPFAVALLFVIEGAMPPITAASIVTEREGGDRALVNQLMLASFLFAVLTVPVFLTLFTFIYK